MRAQCRAAGMTDAVIAHRVRSERWRMIRRGVYQTEPGRSGWPVEATAALLAAADVSPYAVCELPAWTGTPPVALWGESAARAWGQEVRRPRPGIALVVPVGRVVAAGEGTTIRRVRKWEGLVDEHQFPWRTTRAATVIDCGSLGTEDGAFNWLSRGVRDGFVRSADLQAELARRRRVRHGMLMREALGDVAAGAMSTAELRYVRSVERPHGLPPATRQRRSEAGGGSYHDNVYQDFAVVIEVDGRLGHEQWADRVRDGRRDRQLVGLTGQWTSRVFWPDVAVTPCATAVEVAGLLRARGWTGRVVTCSRVGCPVETWSLHQGA